MNNKRGIFFKDNKETCLQEAGGQFHSAPNASNVFGSSARSLDMQGKRVERMGKSSRMRFMM